jgi:hypothetical protein
VAGIQLYTKEWLWAIRSYYADDREIVMLCEFAERLMQGVTSGNEEESREQSRFSGTDDEWTAGG